MLKIKEKPLSPHLSIYKPQITSVLSIIHRMTGAFLFMLVLVACWYLSYNLYHFPYSMQEDDLMQHLFKYMFYLLVPSGIFASFYHLSNGVRHLFWDVGRGYELSTVKKTGWLVVVTSLLLTAITLFFICANI